MAWEYDVKVLASRQPFGYDQVLKELNRLGQEDWECFGVEFEERFADRNWRDKEPSEVDVNDTEHRVHLLLKRPVRTAQEPQEPG